MHVAAQAAGPPSLFFGFCLLITGCLSNQPYHVSSPEDRAPAFREGCEQAFQVSPEAGFDIGIVEFSERGHVFRRDCMEMVLEKVEESTGRGDTAVIVFVHGWRHNAESESETRDQNFHCFKQLLASFAGNLDEQKIDSEICFDNQFPKIDVQGNLADRPKGRGVLHHKRKVVGVYVGWRGLPYRGGLTELASYWDRKSVAEEIGRGGVTELLVRLEDIVWRPGGDRTYDRLSSQDANYSEANNGNVFLTIGHSFGGAIVLSALNEIFIERIVSAAKFDPDEHRRLTKLGDRGGRESGEATFARCAAKGLGNECVITRPFGHGVVLINPAIEATQISQLKELSGTSRFAPNQSRLLHVISTSADSATHTAFPLGQWLGVGLTWRQEKLWRERPLEDWIQVDEMDLDTATVGNFARFRSGYLHDSGEGAIDRPRWCYRTCVVDENNPTDTEAFHDCVDPDQRDMHYVARPYEPVALVYSDESFMNGHNDVFNPRVRAYLAAVVAESLRRRRELPADFSECMGEDFQPCFEFFLGVEEQYLRSEGRATEAIGRFSEQAVCEAERYRRSGVSNTASARR